ncbi:hypothetical protein RJ639_012441 [Escallonia herrerae]|uniref:Nudix hydrolase domain-containing protein n=1 Tax=Escallonia herrerae TaxID=1293975 RepID=A0AA88VJF8_9ASTE|nr:hypothetical protein RJ639_012441 [Escallonia herrerae]
MLKAIQFLGSSSGFFSSRLKPHGNCGLSFVSSRRPTPLISAHQGRNSRAFRVSVTRSESNSDGSSPSSSSSSSSSVAFRSDGSTRKINFCQRCGGPTKHETPDGEEKLRAICTLCGRIAYENPKMVVGCLVEHDNKILLCKRKIQPSYGLWTLPAGYLEIGESAAEGAMRETWEEAGAEVQVLSPFAQLDIPLIGQTYIIFLAKLKRPHFSPGPESSECRLFAIDEIPFDSLAFSSMLYIEDLKAGNLKFHYGAINKRKMDNTSAPGRFDPRSPHRKRELDSPLPWNAGFEFCGNSDRRFAFNRQPSFRQSEQAPPPHTPISIISNDSLKKPFLSRTTSTIDISPAYPQQDGIESIWSERDRTSLLSGSGDDLVNRFSVLLHMLSADEALVRADFVQRLVSDAFHLTFGCGLLTFSLFAMAASRKKPDRVYTYGQLFLLFMSFSIAVEALHAFIQDESEHKHYLIISAVTNLLVNLVGVWFFRNYARINIVYRKAEDMNYHSVCLHVLADSIRRVKNAEVLCLGLVSVMVFMLVMPLFTTTGGILLQTTPPSIPPSALNKCRRQVSSCEDVVDVSQARLWELVPGHVIGSLSLQVKKGVDDRPILEYAHHLYHDLGVQDLTVQTDTS